MFDRPSREHRRQRVVEVVDSGRRALEAEIDVPIVDAAVIDDAAAGVDGGFRRHGDAGDGHERVFRIAQRLGRAGVHKRRHVREDAIPLVGRIGVHQAKRNTLRRELRSQTTHLGRVAVRDGTLGAREQKDDRLGAVLRLEWIDLAAFRRFDAHLPMRHSRTRNQPRKHETTKARNRNGKSLSTFRRFEVSCPAPVVSGFDRHHSDGKIARDKLSKPVSKKRRAARLTAPSTPSVPAPAAWRRVAIIVLAGALAYANCLSNPFLVADEATIVENASIRDLGSRAVFFPEREVPTAGRPVVNVSFAMNYAVGGLSVRGYHLISVAIHLLCAIVLLALVRKTIEFAALAEAGHHGRSKGARTD